jgi:riboflavin kinase/FMN adenylyltransferase
LKKAPTRLTTLSEKIGLLEGQGLDRLYVCPFTDAIAGMSSKLFVYNVLSERLGVRLLLVGHDFRFGSQRGGDVGRLKSLGREVGVEVSTVDGFFVDGVRVSSTSIRQAIARGDTASVRRFLGGI